MARRDPRLLDQAGRDLRSLIETASPDQRPLTRARALALAGAGMAALAVLAKNEAAALQGRSLFEAAADQFTPDHSPMDWLAVFLARADAGEPALETVRRAQMLGDEPGLLLGALARERRLAVETSLAEAVADVEALHALEALIRRRLAAPEPVRPVDWAADQIAMARVALARPRLTGSEPRAVGLMLTEAMETAREYGATALARRAASVLAATPSTGGA